MSRCDFHEQDDRPWPNHMLDRAAIVGHTTSTSARIWIRVATPGRFCLVVAEEPLDRGLEPDIDDQGRFVLRDPDPNASEIVVPTVGLMEHDFAFATDLTHVFDLDGLGPDTALFYAVFTDAPRFNTDASPRTRWELGAATRHVFRTLPETPQRVSFGVFSCHKPFAGDSMDDIVNMNLWKGLHEALSLSDAHFVIGAGDQVYVDGRKKLNIWKWLKKVMDYDCFPDDDAAQVALMADWYRDIYRGYWGFAAVKNVFRSFPTYMIWDDHEIVDGWGSYTDDELDKLLNRWNKRDPASEIPKKRRIIDNMVKAAEQVYREYQHNHNPPTDHLDYDFRIGEVAVYVWDCRGERDYTQPGHPVLGNAQEQRFTSWLESCTAKVIFIVTAVPMVHISSFVVNKADIPWIGAADDLRDEWEHESHWEERDRLLEKVFRHSQTKGSKIAFISGDVHIGAAFSLEQKRFPNAQVRQFTSSAITWSAIGDDYLGLLTKGEGELGHPSGLPEEEKTHFERLKLANQNNFAIVDVLPDAASGVPTVRWTLYEDAQQEDRVTRLSSVEF